MFPPLISCIRLAFFASVFSFSPALAVPVILSQSGSFDVREHHAFVAFVEAEGEGLEYQWFKDDAPVPGATEAALEIASAGFDDAGFYQARVAGAAGMVWSRRLELGVFETSRVGVGAGGRGTVRVPGRLAYYDLYLPTGYHVSPEPMPVLLTHSPSGGGMVGQFQSVAQEKQWIVIGISQSRNLYATTAKFTYQHAILMHALDHLRIDPNRIFVAGFSGGGWSAFDHAKQQAPMVAGVYSMGGWLGDQRSMSRDRQLAGLKVARANGSNDSGANSRLNGDRNFLQNFLAADDIRDWSFSGGHSVAPDWVKREVFDWFLDGTTGSTAEERAEAKLMEARWKARVTAGQGGVVYPELMEVAFDSARSATAVAAMRALDFLLNHPQAFHGALPHGFPGHPRRQYFANHLYFNLFAYGQLRDPSRQIAASAVALAFGFDLANVQWDRWSESESLFRHPLHSALDRYILENSLYDRVERPYSGDWSGDGLGNYAKFVLGGDPLTADRPPGAGIGFSGGEVVLDLPRARPCPFARFEAVAAEHPAGPWTPAALEVRGVLDHGDGSWRLRFSTSGQSGHERRFFRLAAERDERMWLDENDDGIPSDYQFPRSAHWQYPLVAADADVPDSRFDVEFPGGPPLYLRYLAAADLDGTTDFGVSFRYHPALANYRGSLLHELWLNVPGGQIADADVALQYLEPDDVRLIKTTRPPWSYRHDRLLIPGAEYFQRARGWVHPATTGSHVFAIAGNTSAEFWLSSRANNIVGRKRIAFTESPTGYEDYMHAPTQVSEPVTLREGFRYYIEVLHKQDGGGGHWSVAWKQPGSDDFELIPSENLSPVHLETDPHAP